MKTQAIKFKWLISEYDVRSTENTRYPLMSVSQYLGVVPRSELKGDEGRAESTENYKTSKPGQIVLNRMSAANGALGLATEHGLVSPDYAVLQPSNFVEPKYLYYLMKSDWFTGQMVARLKGIGAGGESASVRTPRINISDLGDIDVNLPPIEEQRRIADYLDGKLNAIDGIQQKRSRQILALKEASQSLTLDWVPNKINNIFVEKFESNTGINIRAKYLFQEFKVSDVDAPLASATMDGVLLREEMSTDVWNPQDSTQSYKLVEPGDFVINLRSFQHGFSYSEVRGKVSPAYTVFRLRHELLSKYSSSYFSYLFQSKQFIGQLEAISVGIRQGRNIPYEDFANLLIPIPNTDLQIEIEKQQLRNSARVALLMKSAAPLTELRQSLITSVVTGNSTQNI